MENLQNVLSLAERGDTHSIAASIARYLAPYAVRVRVMLAEDCLWVRLAASQLPDRHGLVEAIRKIAIASDIETIQQVKILAQVEGETKFCWMEPFELRPNKPSKSLSKATTQSRTPLTARVLPLFRQLKLQDALLCGSLIFFASAVSANSLLSNQSAISLGRIALQQLQELESRIEVGISPSEYSQAVADAELAVDEYLASAEAKKEPAVRKELESAIEGHVLALKLWENCYSAREAFNCFTDADPLPAILTKYPQIKTQLHFSQPALKTIPKRSKQVPSPIAVLGSNLPGRAEWGTCGSTQDSL